MPPSATPGPVKVKALSGFRYRVHGNQLVAIGDFVLTATPGGRDCIWSLAAGRSVPLRVTLDVQGSNEVNLKDLQAWISCPGDKVPASVAWVKSELGSTKSHLGQESVSLLGANRLLSLRNEENLSEKGAFARGDRIRTYPRLSLIHI